MKIWCFQDIFAIFTHIRCYGRTWLNSRFRNLVLFLEF